MRITAIFGSGRTAIRGRSAMTRAGSGYRAVAAVAAMLATAGLGLVAQAPASAASLASAHAAAAGQRQDTSPRPAVSASRLHARGAGVAAKAVAPAPASAAARHRPQSSRLPADVKAVCGTPTKTRAECLALVRTNVQARKGYSRRAPRRPGTARLICSPLMTCRRRRLAAGRRWRWWTPGMTRPQRRISACTGHSTACPPAPPPTGALRR